MLTQDQIDDFADDFNLTKLAVEIHQQNVDVGWWDDYPNKIDRHETAIMLVVSELAEAMEGDRKSLNDTHLPAYPMFDVEIADTMIRLLDLAGAYEMSLATVEFEAERFARGLRVMTNPERLMAVIRHTCSARDTRGEVFNAIVATQALSVVCGVRVWSLVALKRAYNAERADHKRTARAAENGKAY